MRVTLTIALSGLIATAPAAYAASLDVNVEVPKLNVAEARALIADGTISGGMIPKIETAIDAVEAGVSGAVILDGRIPHVLLLELFTEHGAGTMIVKE